MTQPSDETVTAIATTFGLHDVQILETHVGYRGTQTFHVASEQGERYLRRYAPYWRGRDPQIAFELAWLEALRADGLPVVRSVRTQDGTAFAHDGAGLPVATFLPVSGKPLYPLSAAEAAHLGGTLAQMHRAPVKRVPYGVFRYDLHTLLTRPAAYGRLHLSSADAHDWDSMERQLEALIRAVPVNDDTFGAVHADLHQWNVHWQGDAVTVLDFALCGFGLRVFDLSGFLWPRRDSTAADDEAVRAMCDAFVAGYDAVRPLCDEEWRALEAAVKLRDLWEMADFAEWQPEFHAPHDVPGYLGRFRAYPGPLRW